MSRDLDGIIRDNMGLVYTVMGRIRRPPEMDEDELLSAGMIGLWRAAQTYDPKKGAFSTLACKCIERHMIKAVREEMGRVPSTGRKRSVGAIPTTAMTPFSNYENTSIHNEYTEYTSEWFDSPIKVAQTTEPDPLDALLDHEAQERRAEERERARQLMLDTCTTDWQREVISLRLNGRKWQDIADATGSSSWRACSAAWCNVRRNAKAKVAA